MSERKQSDVTQKTDRRRDTTRLSSDHVRLEVNKRDIDVFALLPRGSVERAVTVGAMTLTDEAQCQQAVEQASHQTHCFVCSNSCPAFQGQ